MFFYHFSILNKIFVTIIFIANNISLYIIFFRFPLFITIDFYYHNILIILHYNIIYYNTISIMIIF